MSKPHSMRLSDWGLLGLLSLLWGGSFFFSKVALAELPPLTVVLVRVSIATGALWLYLRLRGIPVPAGAGLWRAFFGMGLLNSLVPFTLIFWGQTFIGSGLASIINATTPVFAILVAHALTDDEKMSWDKLAGVALGLAGVVVLLGGAVAPGSGGALPGVLACLGAALCYGLANTYGRRFRRMGIEPAQGAFGQIATTTVMALPLALLADRPWQIAAPGAATWASLAGLALLSTALAYILYFRLIGTVGATNTSLVTMLVPVSAILLGVGILHERLSLAQIGGMLLVGMGLVALDGRVLRRLRQAA
ncbi:DMT family transporter [Roseomonas gilardii]|uniref:DMT family transporter n=1 Tax=Roseomonas gilardii TaxID=257708 RepID=UPI0021B5019B|nr:DMT family transporter [Roseomonas gilardii]